ncbi:hypothetical protein DRJ16_02335 [Candidatus Woesearchaeota archaeon]|nr:MAG: hypothetical protein DRJ16_02335 [Candidatus Woesearchaeota archaeon]
MDFETWIAPVLEGTGYRVESFTGERAVIVNGERRIEIWFRDPWCIEPAPKGKPLKMYMVPHHAYLGCYCYKCIRGAIMQMDKLLEFFGYKAENPTPPLTEEDLSQQYSGNTLYLLVW